MNLRSFLGRRVLPIVFLASFVGTVLADVSLSLDIWHGYDFYYPGVSLSASSPAPVTYHRVESPNGIIWRNFGTNNDSNPLYLTNSLDALLNECNGSWKLYLNQGDGSEELYHFTVSITGVTTNSLGDVSIVFPADGSSGVTNWPTFHWAGPSNLPQVYVSASHDDHTGNAYSDSLPGTSTNWMAPGPLTPGANSFFVNYQSNNFAGITLSVPTNSSGTLTGWTGQGSVFSYKFSGFSVASSGGGGGGTGGHTNLAHYAFDTTSTNPFELGVDSSPSNNSLGGYGYWGQVHTNATDAVVGGGAVEFFGTSGINASDQVLTNLNEVLAGSFTFSTWVKTAASRGIDTDDAIGGATIFWAYNDHDNTNDTIPLAITGNKAAFTTRDHLGNFTTVHSTTGVNDGSYHLITVTRDQANGEMKMYVDGNLEASDFGTTEPLNGNDYYLTLGGTTISSYTGLLDDFQIYSGVLSAADVTNLYANPGTVIPDFAGNPATGITAHYDFDEGNVVAPDVSGNSNALVLAGDFGGSGPATDPAHIGTSGESAYFDGGSFLSAPTNLLSALAGSFTISLWVNTTQDNGDPGNLAWTGDAIISADIPDPGANDLIPVALTGGQIAFNTANTDGDYDHTINSSATVNDGVWHHVVVSRNQPTGDKFIYIDGALDTSDIDSTNLLNDPQLLTIGCKADASNSDPSSPSATGSNGYEGLVDDIQIYDRVLSPDEVAFLYDNPGAPLGTITNTPYPVDVDLHFNISRAEDDYFGQYYSASVSFNSVSPDATTTNSVRSPHNYFHSELFPGGGTGASAILNSLDDVINEFTNGFWKIYINLGSPTQQVYSFQASITGLDTNLLRAVTVFWPTNGAVNVATNPAFQWSGLTNFSTLVVDLLSGPVIFPPVDTTNWPSPPTLNYGPDRFDVAYTSNNFPGVTFTAPLEDRSSAPLNAWNTTVDISSMSFNNFIVGAPAPLPVQILNLQPTNGTFRFSFQTLAGRPHTVQARTNLTTGTWNDLTNFTGDGSLKQFIYPATNPPTRYFRVKTQ